MVASVSSGRRGDRRFARGDPGGVLRRSRHFHADLLTGAGGRLRLHGSCAHGDHRGVAVGLRFDGERPTEDAVDTHSTFSHVDHVDQQTRADPSRKSAGDLLAVRGGGD